MDGHDDRQLKELYREARSDESPGLPDFNDIMSRAKARPASRGGRQFWLAAAAAVVLAVGGVVLLGPDTEVVPDADVGVLAEAVEPVAGGEALASDETDEWNDLLDFADSLWEWESPTDFLL